MKKIMFAAVLFITTYSVQAQSRFGVKAGLNLSTVSTNDTDFNEDRQLRPTYHAGIVLDARVSENFSIQPQLLLQGKGVKVAHGGHADAFRFTSLDLPVNLLYRSGGFFVGGGPNIGINLSGELEVEDNPAENQTFEFGSSAGQFKRANVGVNLMTGYETTGGLFFSVNYLAGLSNWSNATNDTWKNHVIGISIGKMLGK